MELAGQMKKPRCSVGHHRLGSRHRQIAAIAVPRGDRGTSREMNHDDERYDIWNDVGHGLVWLLVIIVLILAAAALIKYLRS
jgi:hypothetical protein